ncbi:hypothetical protein ACFX1W_038058 [Malus domestica]
MEQTTSCHILARVHHIPGPFHNRSTILSALGLPFPHGVIFGNSRATSQWVTHLESALASFLLNFKVPTEPEASELPKGLVLGRDGNIHLKITPLGDVGCYNPHSLRARRPRRYTSGQGLALIPLVTSRPRSTTSRARSTTVARYCPLWTYHSLTVLFLGAHWLWAS